MATAKWVTGTLQGSDGLPRAGILTITPSQSATVPGSAEVVTSPITIKVDATGVYAQQLYANADLAPPGTFYTFAARMADGGQESITIAVPQTNDGHGHDGSNSTTQAMQVTWLITGTTGTSVFGGHVSTLLVDGAATFTAGPITLPVASIADEALSENVALLNEPNVFTAGQTISTGGLTVSAGATQFGTGAGGIGQMSASPAAGTVDHGFVARPNSGNTDAAYAGFGILNYAGTVWLSRLNKDGSATISNGLTITAGGLSVSGAGGVTLSNLTVTGGTTLAAVNVGGAATFNSDVLMAAANRIDTTGAGFGMFIGTLNALGVTIGRAGQTTTIQGDVQMSNARFLNWLGTDAAVRGRLSLDGSNVIRLAGVGALPTGTLVLATSDTAGTPIDRLTIVGSGVGANAAATFAKVNLTLADGGLTINAGGAAITGTSSIVGNLTVGPSSNAGTLFLGTAAAQGAWQVRTNAGLFEVVESGVGTRISITTAIGYTTIAGSLAVGAGQTPATFNLADGQITKQAGADFGTTSGWGMNNLGLTAAASRIVPGVTSLSLRNNASNADNVLVLDDGTTTFRAAAQMAGFRVTGNTIFAAGPGVELAYSAGSAYVQGFNRGVGWLPLVLQGSLIALTPNASGAKVQADGTGIGFYGHATVAQPAAPVTLADVIAIIRGCGLSA